MPAGDGTGPMFGVQKGGRGRMAGGGPGGPANCLCPACGKKIPHTRGIPCKSMKCPGCGMLMTRG